MAEETADTGEDLTLEMLGEDFDGSRGILETNKTVGQMARNLRATKQKLTEVTQNAAASKAPASSEDYLIPEGSQDMAMSMRAGAHGAGLSQEQFTAMVASVSGAESVVMGQLDGMRAEWETEAAEKYGSGFEAMKLKAAEAMKLLPESVSTYLTAAKIHNHPAMLDLMAFLADEVGGDRLVSHMTDGSAGALPTAGRARARMTEIQTSEEYLDGARNEHKRTEEWQKLHAEVLNCGRALARG